MYVFIDEQFYICKKLHITMCLMFFYTADTSSGYVAEEYLNVNPLLWTLRDKDNRDGCCGYLFSRRLIR